jgi:hypothetical protein
VASERLAPASAELRQAWDRLSQVKERVRQEPTHRPIPFDEQQILTKHRVEPMKYLPFGSARPIPEKERVAKETDQLCLKLDQLSHRSKRGGLVKNRPGLDPIGCRSRCFDVLGTASPRTVCQIGKMFRSTNSLFARTASDNIGTGE